MTDNGTSGCKFPGLDTQPTLGFNAVERNLQYMRDTAYPFFLHWPAGGFSKGRDIETLAAHIGATNTG